jgi:hypothetical protein
MLRIFMSSIMRRLNGDIGLVTDELLSYHCTCSGDDRIELIG